jgi:hypothetical protein
VESYLEVPDGFTLGIEDNYVGDVRLVRKTLHAARTHGDSMIDSNVRDGDIVVFERWEFEYVENGQTVVIEKMGDEEGYGSWALKKIIIARSALPFESESQTVDWDLPIISLRSSNPRFKSESTGPIWPGILPSPPPAVFPGISLFGTTPAPAMPLRLRLLNRDSHVALAGRGSDGHLHGHAVSGRNAFRNLHIDLKQSG